MYAVYTSRIKVIVKALLHLVIQEIYAFGYPYIHDMEHSHLRYSYTQHIIQAYTQFRV